MPLIVKEIRARRIGESVGLSGARRSLQEADNEISPWSLLCTYHCKKCLTLPPQILNVSITRETDIVNRKQQSKYTKL